MQARLITRDITGVQRMVDRIDAQVDECTDQEFRVDPVPCGSVRGRAPTRVVAMSLSIALSSCFNSP